MKSVKISSINVISVPCCKTMRNNFFFFSFIIILNLITNTLFAGTSVKTKSEKKAERKSKNVFLNFDLPVYGRINYKDKMVSPLTYSGLYFGGQSGLYKRGIINKFIGCTSIGVVGTLAKNKLKTTSIYFAGVNITTYRLWHVTDFEKYKIHVNAGYYSYNILTANLAGWMNGVSPYFFMFNPVGGSVLFERDFSWTANDSLKIWRLHFKRKERSVRLGWQLSLPMVSFTSRPNYNSLSDETALIKEGFGNVVFSSWNNLLMINSSVSLSYPLKNKSNFLKLSYNWQGMRYYEVDKQFQLSSGYLMFSLLFKLDANKNY